jgi:uncharacterized protein (TIGR02300 family)
MPELKLGTKYECFNCGTKFYDLGKAEPLCPKCGANQRDAAPDTPAASQSSRRKRKADVGARALDVEEDDTAAVEIPDEEIGEGAELDADLDDDEDEDEDFEDEA